MGAALKRRRKNPKTQWREGCLSKWEGAGRRGGGRCMRWSTQPLGRGHEFGGGGCPTREGPNCGLRSQDTRYPEATGLRRTKAAWMLVAGLSCPSFHVGPAGHGAELADGRRANRRSAADHLNRLPSLLTALFHLKDNIIRTSLNDEREASSLKCRHILFRRKGTQFILQMSHVVW